MDPTSTNPFTVMTFIVAPAILTNAASVMGLQTANRFARAIDRARDLSKQIEGRLGDTDPEIALRTKQLESAEHRALILVRALTAFYLAIGAFALASLASLFGAIFHLAHEPITLRVAGRGPLLRRDRRGRPDLRLRTRRVGNPAVAGHPDAGHRVRPRPPVPVPGRRPTR
jgi:hypothetical protein